MRIFYQRMGISLSKHRIDELMGMGKHTIYIPDKNNKLIQVSLEENLDYR